MVGGALVRGLLGTLKVRVRLVVIDLHTPPVQVHLAQLRQRLRRALPPRQNEQQQQQQRTTDRVGGALKVTESGCEILRHCLAPEVQETEVHDAHRRPLVRELG